MAGIEKSVELYELIIARLEDSGVAPNQLAYYRECLDLIRTCSTAEEAEVAMRNSPLYTAGGQALMLDKFIAFAKAMEYCGYDEAAKIYRDKFEEVKDNYASAWDTSYNQKVLDLLVQYTERKSLFMDVILAPVNYMGAGELPSDSGTRKMDNERLKENFAKIREKGWDFFEMAGDPYLRELVPLSDEAYAAYIRKIAEIAQKGTMAPDEDGAEYSRIKEFVSSHKDELRDAARRTLAKKAVVMAVPNESAPYKHEFIDRVEEA